MHDKLFSLEELALMIEAVQNYVPLPEARASILEELRHYDLTNTVPLAEAEACSKAAKDAGVPGVMVWGSLARPQDMMEILAVLGR